MKYIKNIMISIHMMKTFSILNHVILKKKELNRVCLGLYEMKNNDTNEQKELFRACSDKAEIKKMNLEKNFMIR